MAMHRMQVSFDAVAWPHTAWSPAEAASADIERRAGAAESVGHQPASRAPERVQACHYLEGTVGAAVDTIAALSLVVPVAVEIQRLVQARLVQLRDLVDTCRYLEGIAGSAVGTIVVVPAAVEIQCLERAVGLGQSLGVLATEHYQPMQNLKQTWVMLGQLVQQKEQSPRDSAFQRDLVVPR
jgi:hypothetical protein